MCAAMYFFKSQEGQIPLNETLDSVADLGGAQGARVPPSVLNWITSLLLKHWPEKLATHTATDLQLASNV